MKKIILLASAIFSLNAFSQVPNYVPTNGLVGWWPFNGNANDESGNGNNGTVNGPTLTTDRFGNNNAYNFNSGGNIEVPDANSLSFTNKQYSFSFWANFNVGGNATLELCILGKRTSTSGPYEYYFAKMRANHPTSPNIFVPYIWNLNGTCGPYQSNQNGSSSTMGENVWEHFVVTADGTTSKTYKNGVLFFSGTDDGSCILSNSSGNLLFGEGGGWNNTQFMNGKLDDIGIWNRALTQQEITTLYNAANCANNTSISPQTNSLSIGSTALFTVSTSDSNPNYVWQSDFGQGFQTLNNFGSYSGVNTATLNVSNVQLSNHNQKIRAISTTSNNCIDTSNVAQIVITNTCITNVTVYDTTIVYDTVTTYISVTDTLFIDINTTGINNNVINTIKVFPNPTNSHLNLHFGNFNTLNGYSVKILNSLSQIIYNQSITQQSEIIDLSTFGGNGIYFLHIINAQNNTLEVRKIVLQ